MVCAVGSVGFFKAGTILADIAALEQQLLIVPEPITIDGMDSHLTDLDVRESMNNVSTGERIEGLEIMLKENVLTQLAALKIETDGEDARIETKLDDLANTVKDLQVELENTKNALEIKMESANTAQDEHLVQKVTALTKLINQLVDPVAAKAELNSKAIVANKAELVTSIAKFQMPEISWSQTSAGKKTVCKAEEKGMMRRVEGAEVKDYNRVVYCNGKEWTIIAPLQGVGTDIRLPGGGCHMKDVFSYRTTSSGCRDIYFKTNIKAKTNTMYKIDIEGYNYGQGAHIHASAVGYTYQGWSCRGNDKHTNYNTGSSVSTYCAGDQYLVLQMSQGSSYFTGMSISASFLNPTGDAMCGKFEITKVTCNTRI